MKPVYYISGILGLSVVTYLIARKYIEPKFKIESQDNMKKEGIFSFGGITNSFNLSKGGSVTARNGYGVTYGTKDGKSVYFDLYKNGVFIRTLKTVFN